MWSILLVLAGVVVTLLPVPLISHHCFSLLSSITLFEDLRRSKRRLRRFLHFGNDLLHTPQCHFIHVPLPLTSSSHFLTLFINSLKEKLFIEEPGLDIFVVNSTASLFQLLLQPLFLPLTLLFNQTMGLPFSDYIRDGFMYFPHSLSPSELNP